MGKRNKTTSKVHEEENIESEEEQQQTNNHDVGQSSSNDKSLYEILGVERTATQQEIKKAYHKLALRLHPDKNPDDEDAKEKFQQLQKVISILGDEEKRSLYDQTGCVDDAVSNLHIL
ncbi:DnaJ domain-containing protein [Artemisia annua]|uniref:DnaJ domain-containing protein n=1 Tax=Artemisia annua TaxID=35608 RepID=A0A2U1PNR6_ARTAN|nr:DnaJ domain-containing protein [Artemisia annua]